MPARLDEIIVNRARVTIAGDGWAFFVEYQPNALTPRMRAVAKAMPTDKPEADLTPAERDMAMDALTNMLAAVLLDWDLLDRDGEPLPPTREGLQDVSYAVQTRILASMFADVSPGEANGVTRSPGSSTPISPAATRAASRRPSRSGTRPRR